MHCSYKYLLRKLYPFPQKMYRGSRNEEWKLITNYTAPINELSAERKWRNKISPRNVNVNATPSCFTLKSPLSNRIYARFLLFPCSIRMVDGKENTFLRNYRPTAGPSLDSTGYLLAVSEPLRQN